MDSSVIVIRRVEKSDEEQIERLLVDDVYSWPPWIWISLKHGFISAFPRSTCLATMTIALLVYCAFGSLQYVAGSLAIFFLLISAISLLKMAGIIHFVRSYPEFAQRNLTETYEEEGCAFFVASVAGRIVGCVGVKKKDGNEGDLYRMAVSWTCQGRGIGKKLIAAAVEFANDQKYEKLTLRTSHIIQAHLFYQRAGFQIVKTMIYWVVRVLPVCVYQMDRVLIS